MTNKRPISNPPVGLRQRFRGGKWVIWWEPTAAIRALGFEPVTLDANRLTWSVREAARLNASVVEVREIRAGGGGDRPVVQRRGGNKSIHDLIVAFRQAPQWDNLKPATQKDYMAAFRLIERKWGSQRVIDFDKPIMLDWYENLYTNAGKWQAASLIRKMSLLFSYAEAKGWRGDNPCSRLRLTIPKSRSRIASWPEIDALLAACADKPSMGCAITLATFQGQRLKDVIEAKRADFAGEMWRFVRSKRGNHGAMSIHPEVLPWMTRAMQGDPTRDTLLIYEGTNRPYNLNLFGKVWARVRATAAQTCPEITDLQFRDLRRTFGHLARMNGASERDVADALGNNAWHDPKLSGTYMPANADTASRAVQAIARPEIETKTKEVK